MKKLAVEFEFTIFILLMILLPCSITTLIPNKNIRRQPLLISKSSNTKWKKLQKGRKMKISNKLTFFQITVVLLTIHSSLANLPEPSILEFHLSKVRSPRRSARFDFSWKSEQCHNIFFFDVVIKYVRHLQEDYAIQIPITLLRKTKLNVAGEIALSHWYLWH